MSAELAVVEQPQHGIDVGLWAETLIFAKQLADAVHDTEFVPKALRGRPEAVAATIMYGAEVGVTPMQALAGIHIVDGRPSPSAELMRAMILRAGHAFTIHEMSGTRVRVSGLRCGRPESERVVVDWSLDMARSAGLLGKQNWRNYPRAMLTARAFGDLARVLFPDVVKGLGYVAEDASVDELDTWAGEGSDSPPAKPRKALQRRQRRVVQSTPDEPSEPQNGSAELPPVAPPHDPHAAASPSDNVDTVDELRARYDAERDELERREQAAEQPPETVADELVERRAEILQRQRYDDDDQTMPDDMQPKGTGRPLPLPLPQPEQTPPEPPLPGVKTMADQPFRAMQTGLTRELGTVATREERHALVSAILGKPIETTEQASMSREDGYRVLDMLSRFADGSASWQLDLGTGGMTISDNREPPDEGGAS